MLSILEGGGSAVGWVMAVETQMLLPDSTLESSDRPTSVPLSLGTKKGSFVEGMIVMTSHISV